LIIIITSSGCWYAVLSRKFLVIMYDVVVSCWSWLRQRSIFSRTLIVLTVQLLVQRTWLYMIS